MHEAIAAFEAHQPARGLELARELVAVPPDMTAGREIYAFMLRQNERVPESSARIRYICADRRSSFRKATIQRF